MEERKEGLRATKSDKWSPSAARFPARRSAHQWETRGRGSCASRLRWCTLRRHLSGSGQPHYAWPIAICVKIPQDSARLVEGDDTQQLEQELRSLGLPASLPSTSCLPPPTNARARPSNVWIEAVQYLKHVKVSQQCGRSGQTGVVRI